MRELPATLGKVSGLQASIEISHCHALNQFQSQNHWSEEGGTAVVAVLGILSSIFVGCLTSELTNGSPSAFIAAACTVMGFVAFSINRKRRWLRDAPIGRVAAALRARVQRFATALNAYRNHVHTYNGVYAIAIRGDAADEPSYADAWYDLLVRAHETLTRECIAIEVLAQRHQNQQGVEQPTLVAALAQIVGTAQHEPNINYDDWFRDEHAAEQLERELQRMASATAIAGRTR